MNSTSYPLTLVPTGEKPVLTDDNEDLVLEQLRAEIMQIKTEIGQTEKPGLASKLGFKKLPKNATISVESNPENTSNMNPEVIPPSETLREALELAIPAAPIDPEHLILDPGRVNEALGARAKVLVEPAVSEAEVVSRVGGYSKVSAGEALIIPIEEVRGLTREVIVERRKAIGVEAR